MLRHQSVAHSTALRDAGYSDQTVRKAVTSGRLIRVRRSWLVGRDCTPARRAAAEAGGRITCVTAAAEMGLWTPQEDRVHIAVAPTASRLTAPGLVTHWSKPPIPVPTRSTDEPIVNVLFHVARCLAPADGLAVWESAIRMRVVSDEELARVRWRSTAARRFAELASSLSDSGLETRFLWIMREIGVTVRQQVWIDGHRVDALIGDFLIVQLDGFEHHRAADRRRDIRADARLTLRGYTVLRFDFHQLMFDPEHVRSTVRSAIAQGLHRGR